MCGWTSVFFMDGVAVVLMRSLYLHTKVSPSNTQYSVLSLCATGIRQCDSQSHRYIVEFLCRLWCCQCLHMLVLSLCTTVCL